MVFLVRRLAPHNSMIFQNHHLAPIQPEIYHRRLKPGTLGRMESLQRAGIILAARVAVTLNDKWMDREVRSMVPTFGTRGMIVPMNAKKKAATETRIGYSRGAAAAG